MSDNLEKWKAIRDAMNTLGWCYTGGGPYPDSPKMNFVSKDMGSMTVEILPEVSKPTSVYGFCKCGSPVVSRTRGIPCYDRCEKGHKHLSSETLAEKPVDPTDNVFGGTPERQWPEGGYSGVCYNCHKTFTGPKRAGYCFPCYNEMTAPNPIFDEVQFIEVDQPTYTYSATYKIEI